MTNLQVVTICVISATVLLIFGMVFLCLRHHLKRTTSPEVKVSPLDENDEEGRVGETSEEKENDAVPEDNYYSEFKEKQIKTSVLSENIQIMKSSKVIRKLPALPPNMEGNEYSNINFGTITPPIPVKEEAYYNVLPVHTPAPILPPKKNEVPPLPPKKKPVPLPRSDKKPVPIPRSNMIPVSVTSTKRNQSSMFLHTQNQSLDVIEDSVGDQNTSVMNHEYGILSDCISGEGQYRAMIRHSTMKSNALIVEKRTEKSVAVNTEGHIESLDELLQRAVAEMDEAEDYLSEKNSEPDIEEEDSNISESDLDEHSLEINCDEELTENYVDRLTIQTVSTTEINVEESIEIGNVNESCREENELQSSSLESFISKTVKAKRFTCRFCKRTVKSMDGFRLHMHELHSKCFCKSGPTYEDQNDSIISDEEVTEGRKLSAQMQQLEKETLDMGKKFKCSICNKSSGKTNSVKEFQRHLYQSHERTCFCQFDLREFRN